MSKAKTRRLHWMIDHCMTIERLWDESMEECRELRATIEKLNQQIASLEAIISRSQHNESLFRKRQDDLEQENTALRATIEKLNQQIASLEAIISCSQHNESLFRKRQDDLEQENTALRGENEELITQLENTRNTPDIRPFGPEIPARTTTKKETV